MRIVVNLCPFWKHSEVNYSLPLTVHSEQELCAIMVLDKHSNISCFITHRIYVWGVFKSNLEPRNRHNFVCSLGLENFDPFHACADVAGNVAHRVSSAWALSLACNKRYTRSKASWEQARTQVGIRRGESRLASSGVIVANENRLPCAWERNSSNHCQK